VMTLDHASEMPAWKSTASGMSELLVAKRIGEAARKRTPTSGRRALVAKQHDDPRASRT